MTRTFWIILGLIVVAIGGFASMVSFGSSGGVVRRRWAEGGGVAHTVASLSEG